MNSIKWRFVLIYFLLVLAVLITVSTSITNRLEASLINDRIENVKTQIRSLITSSSYFDTDILDDNVRGIKASLNERRFSSNDDIFVISNADFETILASKTDSLITYEGQYVYNVENLNLSLIQEGYQGNTKSIIVNDDDGKKAHLIVPILGEESHVKGLIYAIIKLDTIFQTLSRAKRIIYDSGLVALVITIVLSYIIASGITGPIRRVTEVSKKMAEGDFNQRVPVKSNDEIGQLSSMFNLMSAELKKNIQKTELERAKLDTIFNQMLEGVVAINSDGNLIHINDRAREIFDIPRDLNINDISISFSRLGLGALNFQNPYTLSGEVDEVIGEKSYRILHAPFEDKELNVGGVIAVYQDMTKERKLEDMRREFVANVSHELKTPITSIKSYTETLLKYPVDAETQKKFLGVIDNESDRMAHIVRDLLTLTTLDYKTEEKQKSLINLSDIAHAATERMSIMASEKNMKIYEHYSDSFSYAIEEDLLQVIINLISNAIKYTDEFGEIKIATASQDKYNYVHVKDNGSGIPLKDQPHIFERFYRVEKSRSRDLGGTGLGLAIAKEMIENMDGEISVMSDGKNGSTFAIRLKAVDQDGKD